MAVTSQEWLAAFAVELGIEPPSSEEIEAILGLAGTAAHQSERTAAPIACWLSARAGLSASEAREVALRVEVANSGAE